MQSKVLTLLTLCLISLSAMGQEYKLDLESFKNFKSSIKADNRVIEGSSPIIGYQLVMDIKNSSQHPEDTYRKILKSNKDYSALIYSSADAYFKTMMPGLDDYCSTKVITGKRDQWTAATGNHGAAIPQEVIEPITNDYIENLDDLLRQKSNKSSAQIKSESIKLAKEFQNKRYNCRNVKKIKALEKRLEGFCLKMGFCLKIVKIHSAISSAEAAYPRKQFSINGFTRYVYDQLMMTTDLQKKIRVIYDAEVEWIDLKQNNETQEELFSYVVEKALDQNIHIKDVMLILAYSMRNMPSLDVEYTQSPKKALLLETYFWSFRDLRTTLSKAQYFKHVFPDHEFKRNPGFYHYLTAALLGCEGRLAGLSHTNSVLMGIMTKVGYKTDKLLKAIEKEEMAKRNGPQKFKYIKSIMKKQGSWAGISAGMHAARFGSKQCKAYKKILKKQFKKDKKEVRKNKELTRTERKELIKELKLQFKNDYRSILDDEKYWN